MALNCFRIITREQYDEASTAWHFHAYLMNIDLSEENPDERTIEVLLDTRSIAAFPTYLRTPAAALAILLLLSARNVNARHSEVLG